MRNHTHQRFRPVLKYGSDTGQFRVRHIVYVTARVSTFFAAAARSVPDVSYRKVLPTNGNGSARLWRLCTPAMAAESTDHV